MANRIPILLSVAFAVAGCDTPPPPPPPPAAKAPTPQAAKPASSEKLAESAPTIEYAYSPVGKRDPFRSIIDEINRPTDGGETRADCGPLCKWELDQLKLVAVISGVSNPLAMVEDPNGRGYIVRRGTFVGKLNGKVTQIRSGEVVVTEIYKDQMGKPHVNPRSIKLPADAAQNQDDQNLLTPEVAE